MGLITLRQLADGQRPAQSKTRIERIERSLGRRHKGRRVAVDQFDVITQGLKTMCKSDGNQQRIVIVR